MVFDITLLGYSQKTDTHVSCYVKSGMCVTLLSTKFNEVRVCFLFSFVQQVSNYFHIKTPFFDHKIKTLFTRFDFDHNGKIDKNDFENWANNLSRAGNLSEEKAEILRQSINQIWNVYFLPADTNNDGSVEYLELLDHMKAVREFK